MPPLYGEYRFSKHEVSKRQSTCCSCVKLTSKEIVRYSRPNSRRIGVRARRLVSSVVLLAAVVVDVFAANYWHTHPAEATVGVEAEKMKTAMRDHVKSVLLCYQNTTSLRFPVPWMQWRRFGSKSGGTRNGRGGCELKVGDKVYISEVPQFWEWGIKQCCERNEQKIFWVSTPNCDIFEVH